MARGHLPTRASCPSQGGGGSTATVRRSRRGDRPLRATRRRAGRHGRQEPVHPGRRSLVARRAERLRPVLDTGRSPHEWISTKEASTALLRDRPGSRFSVGRRCTDHRRRSGVGRHRRRLQFRQRCPNAPRCASPNTPNSWQPQSQARPHAQHWSLRAHGSSRPATRAASASNRDLPTTASSND